MLFLKKIGKYILKATVLFANMIDRYHPKKQNCFEILNKF